MLDTRETAALIWLSAAVIAAWVFVPTVRTSRRDVIRLLFGWKLLLPVLVIAGWICGAVFVAARLGLWEADLVGDTVLTALSVFALMFSFDRAVKEKRFVRRVARDTLMLAVFVEAFINLRPFPLAVELVTQPVVALMAMISVVAGSKPDLRPAKRLIDSILGLLGIVVLMLVIRDLTHSWRDNVREDLLSVVLPVWLVLVSLPVVYAVWIFAAYEAAFLRVNFMPQDERPPRFRARLRSRLALVLAFHGRVRDVGSVNGYTARRIREAKSLRDAVAAARSGRQERLDREAVDATARQRLDDNAGLDGVDDEGRQLDQREFAETRQALRWIATCHMGWYDRKKRYRHDLLDMLSGGGTFTNYGLPEEHGIEMKVSKDGQRWFAARRTITGWWFAIGAAGPPPDQWTYDGASPPDGYPGLDPKWGDGPFSDGPNW